MANIYIHIYAPPRLFRDQMAGICLYTYKPRHLKSPLVLQPNLLQRLDPVTIGGLDLLHLGVDDDAPEADPRISRVAQPVKDVVPD